MVVGPVFHVVDNSGSIPAKDSFCEHFFSGFTKKFKAPKATRDLQVHLLRKTEDTTEPQVIYEDS